MNRTIVILGAGIGGSTVALRLREQLAPEHRIVVVERSDAFVLGASLLRVLTGESRIQDLRHPTQKLAQRGIELVVGDVRRINADTRTVTVGERQFHADVMIIALGAQLAPHAIAGLSEAGHNLYSPDGVQSFHDALQRFRGGKLALLTGAPIYKCPAAPYEACMLIEANLRQRNIRSHTEITFYAAEPGPMGVAGPEVSKAVRVMVESKGIRYLPERSVRQAQSHRLTFADGSQADFDLLGYVPPHQAPAVVQDAGLCDDHGWVAVNRCTLATRFKDVYALGDITGIPLSIGKLLPKAGVFAEGAARVVADNIVASIRGQQPTAVFDGHGECYVEMGDGRAGWGIGNFFAEPAPQVVLHPASAEYHEQKRQWERGWAQRWT